MVRVQVDLRIIAFVDEKAMFEFVPLVGREALLLHNVPIVEIDFWKSRIPFDMFVNARQVESLYYIHCLAIDFPTPNDEKLIIPSILGQGDGLGNRVRDEDSLTRIVGLASDDHHLATR